MLSATLCQHMLSITEAFTSVNVQCFSFVLNDNENNDNNSNNENNNNY